MPNNCAGFWPNLCAIIPICESFDEQCSPVNAFNPKRCAHMLVKSIQCCRISKSEFKRSFFWAVNKSYRRYLMPLIVCSFFNNSFRHGQSLVRHFFKLLKMSTIICWKNACMYVYVSIAFVKPIFEFINKL